MSSGKLGTIGWRCVEACGVGAVICIVRLVGANAPLLVETAYSAIFTSKSRIIVSPPASRAETANASSPEVPARAV